MFPLSSPPMVSIPPILAVTASQWAALSTKVGGRLYTNAPFAASCFPSLQDVGSVANASACSIVKANYIAEGTYNSYFKCLRHSLFPYVAPRVGVFGAYTNTQWETCQITGEQCLLDWTNPNNTIATSPPYTCSYGSVSKQYVSGVIRE
jgi:hypothetical protein